VTPVPPVGKNWVRSAGCPESGYVAACWNGGMQGGRVGDGVIVAGHVCGEWVFDWEPVVRALDTGGCEVGEIV